MNVRIGSVKHNDVGVYIGRASRGREASVLANPYPITKHQSREAVLQKYRHWLWRKIKDNDEVVTSELMRLLRLACRPGGVTLLCWCRSVGEEEPACHGDVINAALEWLAEDQVFLEAVTELGAVPVRIG